LVLLFSAAGRCATPPPAGDGEAIRPAETGHGDGTPYHLDPRHPSVRQAIEPRDPLPQGSKFVQIEVAKVTNPQRHPLKFEVRYQSGDNPSTFLGSFSLYPSDHPGTFIVPTLGRLKDEGALVLSLVTLDAVGDRDTISVEVRKMKFVNG
jgi:hypothetical protein